MSELNKIFTTLGVTSIMIISDNGLPLITREYSEGISFNQNNLLISGFFSALHSFAQTYFLSQISDIGTVTNRLFFKFHGDLIYIIAVHGSKMQEKKVEDVRLFVDEVLWRLTSDFWTYYKNIKNTAKGFDLNIRLESYGDTVDQLIQEGCQDWLDTHQDADEFIAFPLSPGSEDTTPAIASNGSDTILEDWGIEGFYALYQNQILANIAIKDGHFLSSAGEIMSNFLKSVQSFVQTTFFTRITDIGIFNHRIYLMKSIPFTFLLITNDRLVLEWTLAKTQTILKSVLNNISKVFHGNNLVELPGKTIPGVKKFIITIITAACLTTSKELKIIT